MEPASQIRGEIAENENKCTLRNKCRHMLIMRHSVLVFYLSEWNMRWRWRSRQGKKEGKYKKKIVASEWWTERVDYFIVAHAGT